MPRVELKQFAEIRLRVGPDHRERLEIHSGRLGMNMADIVKAGLSSHLDHLDEKMLISEQAKSKRSGGEAKPLVPKLVEHKFSAPTGMMKNKPKFTLPTVNAASVATGAVEIPKKFLKSFRRWAEHIEAAIGKSDAEQRSEAVLQDMRERGATEEEVVACYSRFKDFLAARRDARNETEEMLTLDEGVTVMDQDD